LGDRIYHGGNATVFYLDGVVILLEMCHEHAHDGKQGAVCLSLLDLELPDYPVGSSFLHAVDTKKRRLFIRLSVVFIRVAQYLLQWDDE
jgi:hypothetical protein